MTFFERQLARAIDRIDTVARNCWTSAANDPLNSASWRRTCAKQIRKLKWKRVCTIFAYRCIGIRASA